jgi:hypothetical protein
MNIKPLNAELNPICNLLALLGAHRILHVSRIRVNSVGESQDCWRHVLRYNSVTFCVIPLPFVFVECKQRAREQSGAAGRISVSHNDAKYHICMYSVAVTILTQLLFNTVRCHTVSVGFLKPQLIICIACKFSPCEEQSS